MAALIRAMVGSGPLVAVEVSGVGPVWGLLGGAESAAGWLWPAAMRPLDAGRLPFADASQAAIVLSLIGSSPASEQRVRLLVEIQRVLGSGGRLFLVDHNRPRSRLAALYAVIAAPAPPGGSPGVRWRRLRYTAAREVQDAGLVVLALRLAGSERVQVVIAQG